MKQKVKALGYQLRRHRVALLLALLGYALGMLTLGLHSCSSKENHEGHQPQGSQEEKRVWTCSMHPQIQKSEPGQCPICGMDLIPLNATEDLSALAPNQVVLSERAQALAELRTTPVRRRSRALSQVRLLGRVQADETTLRAITAWTGGRIDRLHVSATGESVKAGQGIATLYSPEIFAAHQDLLVAKRQVERLDKSSEASRRAVSQALEAARERLRLLGVSDGELSRMENQSSPTRSVTIRTPYAGTVIERMATEGAYVTTGTPLYRIADLSKLWVQLDAYESDLPSISEGQTVLLTVDALPSEEFEGKVTFIDPTLDQRKRTAQVRVEVTNNDGRLRPGMFAEATLIGGESSDDEKSPLVVPKTAPLFTGRRAIVYVEKELESGTRYEARTVRLGPRLGDFYPVVAGLSEGERVVSRGAFALDADLQIRGGASMMTRGDDTEEGGWDSVIELSEKERAKLSPTITAYLDVQQSLAQDRLEDAKKAARRLDEALVEVDFAGSPETKSRWPALASDLRQGARLIEKAHDLEGARAAFEDLSGAVESLLRNFGNPLEETLHLAFCPMASGSRGASWIQEGTAIENSYFGASMSTCGEITTEVAPDRYLGPKEVSGAPGRGALGAEGHKH